MSCADCEKLKAEIKGLKTWKRNAIRILLDIYNIGADIERLIPAVKDDRSKT